MARERFITYGDFRPLHKGETGYSSARHYVSPSTGEIIPRSQFIKLARGETYAQSIQRKRILGGEIKKQKTRKDKKHKRYKTKKKYIERKNRFIESYMERVNEGKSLNERIYQVPDEAWNIYDRLKHPSQYSKKLVQQAWDYFPEEERYEYPEGDTP